MKKLLATLLITVAAVPAYAYTFWYNGVLMGTVCRSGIYYTAYPRHMAQPVGTMCPIRDSYGVVIGQGYVSEE